MSKLRIWSAAVITAVLSIGIVYAMSSSKRYDYKIPLISNAEYAQIVKAGKKIAVVYNATWCPSCQAQHEALTSVKGKYENKLAFYTVDWDKVGEFAGPKVKQRTTIAIIQKDAIVDELVGETRPEKIEEFLKKNTK